METYHKIQSIFKRDMSNKGKMIHGDWSTPELEYLQDNIFEFTEKVDGTNIRIGFHNNGLKFGGRSNNAVITAPLLEYLTKTFVLEDMLEHFDIGNSTVVTLFGEGYGPKIQGGGKYRSDHSFVLYDVTIDDWWLKRDDVNDIADKLGIDSVPVIGYGTLRDAIGMVKGGLESTWGVFEAEGLVCRPEVALFDRQGNRIIVKVKGLDFK